MLEKYQAFTILPASVDLMAALRLRMAADHGHRPISVTHLVLKHGDIIGCFNVAETVYWWMDSHRANARDSILARRELEKLLEMHGFVRYIILVQETSPYFPRMEKLGYHYLGPAHAYEKQLIQPNNVL